MPTSTRREKIALLNEVLETCRKNDITYKTGAIADVLTRFIKPFGFGVTTEREYVRLLVDALEWEMRNGKPFTFSGI